MNANDTAISVVGIVASPHGGGSTKAAVQALLDGARQAGATVNIIDVAVADHGSAVRAIDECDAVVFGSPTYRASHTALLAGLLEKIQRGSAHETSAPLAGKACAIVITGASDAHFLAPERLRNILAGFFAAQVLSPSAYLGPTAFDDDKRPVGDALALLALHGRALVELAAAVRQGAALRRLRPLV